MKTWRCNDCETEFNAERSTACSRCGSTDTTALPRIVSFGPSAVNTEAVPEVRAILRNLCRDAYETPYGGVEWETAIDKAIDDLRSLKGAKRV